MEEDDAAVLGAPVGALAVELGGIVEGEEELEELGVGDAVGVVGELDDFGVAGEVGADGVVAGVVSGAAFVADGGFKDAGNLLEFCFDSPEAACAECRECHRKIPPPVTGCHKRWGGFSCGTAGHARCGAQDKAKSTARRQRTPRNWASAQTPRFLAFSRRYGQIFRGKRAKKLWRLPSICG